MINQCSFIGNLGADPEIRSFQNGGRVCNLRLAVTEKWKSKDGERKEKTEWVSIVINGDGLVGVAEKYLRKGSKIFVQGKLSSRKWTDQQGNDRYTTEIVVGMGGALTMLDGPSGNSGGQSQRRETDRDDTHGQVGGGGYDDLDDDLPF